MKKLLKTKRWLFSFSILLMIVVIIITFNRIGKGKKVNKKMEGKKEEQLIPTITEADIEVSLKSEIAGKEVMLLVGKIPQGTTTFDYELSYKTRDKGLQGVIGTVTSDEFVNASYHKKITLGTCSSGKCVYHNVVGQIDLTLKFYGNYGEKLFEKKYQL